MVKTIPCSHCIAKQFPNPAVFSFEDCVKAVEQGKVWLNCERDPKNVQPVRIDHIAPDIRSKIKRVMLEFIAFSDKFERHSLYFASEPYK